MNRYIDADEAIKVMACEMYAEAQSQGYDVDGVEDFIPEATAWMNDAPSIDIVRCKECKYEGRCRKAVEHITHEPTSVTIGCKAVDFCSFGERKERCKECWYWSEVHQHCENKGGCQFKPYGERREP